MEDGGQRDTFMGFVMVLLKDGVISRREAHAFASVFILVSAMNCVASYFFF
jgi:hypothetical protein